MHGPVVEVGYALAGRLARVDVVIPPVGDQEVARRQPRVGGRAIEGRILSFALETPQRFLLAVLEARDHVEVAAAEAGGDVQPMRLGIAFLGLAVAVIDSGAIRALLQDEVDHAGDRVRSIDGRCAAGQHLDAVDHPERQAGDIGEVAAATEWQREVRDAPSVHQHQGVVGAECAQVDLLCAGREIRPARRLLALGLAAVLGQGLHHVRHAGETTGLDVLGGDDTDRCRAFHLRARDARTGHHHAVEGGLRRGRGFLLRWLLWRILLRLRHAGQCQEQRGLDRKAERALFHRLPL